MEVMGRQVNMTTWSMSWSAVLGWGNEYCTHFDEEMVQFVWTADGLSDVTVHFAHGDTMPTSADARAAVKRLTGIALPELEEEQWWLVEHGVWD